VTDLPASLADLDPMAGLRVAAQLDSDKRTAAAVTALRSMIAAGADPGALAVARDYVKREHLMSAGDFDSVAKAARASSTEAKGDPERKSASTELAEIACERYEFGLGDSGETFAVPKAGPRIALMLRGGKTSLRAQLARDYYGRTGRAAGQQALADALMVLDGMAQEQDETRLCLRASGSGGCLWLDLGDLSGRAVRITAAGWGVEDSAPVLFKRTALNGPLPEPARGGDITVLWDWLNVSEPDRPLVLAWLVACLFTGIPHPVLGVFGEQGTGKTTAAKVLATLLDPGPVPVRKPPRDADSWITAAAGSWVVALDNLSEIPPWLSDSLCRAVTGDGDVRRKLYTDGELAVFSFRRCILINGIDTGALAPDLAERMLPIDLERIDGTRRRAEEDFWPAWQEAHQRLLGALLSLTADVLARLPGTSLAALPRMADFARILAAVDEALGTDGLSRYLARGEDLAADGLSGDSFAVQLETWIIGQPDRSFAGTSAELLAVVRPVDPQWRAPRDWPKDGRAVTSKLQRLAPALRKTGWSCTADKDSHSKLRTWALTAPVPPEKAGSDHRSSPQPPHPAEDAVMSGDEYRPSQYDGPPECTICGGPLDAWLAEAGFTDHGEREAS